MHTVAIVADSRADLRRIIELALSPTTGRRDLPVVVFQPEAL